MDVRISRRSLLAAGIGAAAAGLGLAACGGERGRAGDRTGGTTTSAPPPDELQVIIASAQLLPRPGERFTLGVLADDEPINDPEISLRLGRSFNRLGPPMTATRHSEGIESRPYWLAHVNFDAPGEWVVVAAAGNRSGGAAFTVIDPASTEVPLPGEKMIPVATPTVADARGVDPICTRNPPCPFHQVSLDDALRAGKPVAALFATPALCQSRVCGPVLDVLVSQAPTVGDRVSFVHIEVYRSLKVDLGDPASLTDGMRAYHLTFEPILFLAGADGTVRERLDGPFDAAECREALSRLIG